MNVEEASHEPEQLIEIVEVEEVAQANPELEQQNHGFTNTKKKLINLNKNNFI